MRTFREAAPAVERFYALMQEGWDGCATPKKGFACWVVQAGIEKRCADALDAAERAASHPNALEMIRRLKMQWRQAAAALGRIAIPFVAAAAEVALDAPVWAKARSLNDFRLPSIWNWGEPTPARVPTQVAAFHDSTRLYVLYRAGATNAVTLMPKRAEEAWPQGDHGEIYLRCGSDTYLFAFDGHGNAHDARAFDKRWNSKWTLQARTMENGWEAVAAIPLADVGYAPGEKGSTLSLFILRHLEAGPVREDSSLSGGNLGRQTYPLVLE